VFICVHLRSIILDITVRLLIFLNEPQRHRGHREKISVIFVWEGSIFLVHLINYVRTGGAFTRK